MEKGYQSCVDDAWLGCYGDGNWESEWWMLVNLKAEDGAREWQGNVWHMTSVLSSNIEAKLFCY